MFSIRYYSSCVGSSNVSDSIWKDTTFNDILQNPLSIFVVIFMYIKFIFSDQFL